MPTAVDSNQPFKNFQNYNLKGSPVLNKQNVPKMIQKSNSKSKKKYRSSSEKRKRKSSKSNRKNSLKMTPNHERKQLNFNSGKSTHHTSKSKQFSHKHLEEWKSPRLPETKYFLGNAIHGLSTPRANMNNSISSTMKKN